ncbi:MAG: hypothetical protein C5S52_04510 [ANME-2 cluster archaeon]|nr:hypothetical protein [ANME-2 cluster archaeon]
MKEICFRDRDRILYVPDQLAEVNLKIRQQPCDIPLIVVVPVLGDKRMFGQIDIPKLVIVPSRVDADDMNSRIICVFNRFLQVFGSSTTQVFEKYQIIP